MQQYKQPTSQEVRDWLRDLVAAHKPPPSPEVIREQLWQQAEAMRRQALS